VVGVRERPRYRRPFRAVRDCRVHVEPNTFGNSLSSQSRVEQAALLNEQIAAKNHAYEFGIDREDITNGKWPCHGSRGCFVQRNPACANNSTKALETATALPFLLTASRRRGRKLQRRGIQRHFRSLILKPHRNTRVGNRVGFRLHSQHGYASEGS
jgi:hypothetical protein